LLGRLFHETFAGLTGPDARVNLVRPLERADADALSWRKALVAHCYAWHVAPALARHESDLRGNTSLVLRYWAAVQNLAAWLGELMWREGQAGRSPAQVRADVFRLQESPVSIELEEAGWRSPVVVEGRIDAVLRRPSDGRACVVELKLGRAAPEADLAQAALYRLMYAQATGTPDVDLALLTFGPEPHERRFSAAEVVEAERRLKALAGRLAGVAPEARAAAPVTQARVEPNPARAKRHAKLQARLFDAFAEFGVRLRPDGEPQVGPRFIRFFAEPERRVKVKGIEAHTSSVWVRLKTSQPPLVAVHRGRITIDVERPDPVSVAWRDLRPQLSEPQAHGCSRFPVGVAIDGDLGWADLAKPEDAHFLVAGTTGSGKSEWLRAMLASLLVANTPATLRLVLIDPKRTAFHAFEGSASLWRPVVYPSDEDVTEVFAALTDEMERRYSAFAREGVADLAAHVAEQGVGPLPRIVCVCDEFADLVLQDTAQRKRIEKQVARLGSKARAAGIHLVFATQRPSVDVVRGTIRTNLTAKVALRVGKPQESQIIIDHPGAATLLGKGDLLFKDLGDPVRLQSPLVDDADLAALV